MKIFPKFICNKRVILREMWVCIVWHLKRLQRFGNLSSFEWRLPLNGDLQKFQSKNPSLLQHNAGKTWHVQKLNQYFAVLKLSNEEGHTKRTKYIEERVMNCFWNQRVSQYQINHSSRLLVHFVDNILLWLSFRTTR